MTVQPENIVENNVVSDTRNFSGDLFDDSYLRFELPRIQRSQQILNATHDDYENISDKDGVKESERLRDASNAYFADSWPEDAKRQRPQGEPMTDVARFAPIVDTISGNEIQDKVAPHAFSYDTENQFTADAANLYLKYRMNQEGRHENSTAFRQGITQGRFHYEYAVEPAGDGTFQTKRYVRRPEEVFIRKPFIDYDCRKTSPGRFHLQWVSFDDLKSMYPEIERERWQFLDWHLKSDTSKVHDHPQDGYKSGSDPDAGINSDLYYDRTAKNFRLVRYWEKFERIHYRVINAIDPQSLNDVVVGEYKSRAAAMKKAREFVMEKSADDPESGIFGLDEDGNVVVDEEMLGRRAKSLLEAFPKVMWRYHVFSGRIELEWDEVETLPWVDYFAFFMSGRWAGLFERARDVVYEVNYIHAKLIRALGTLGKPFIFVEEDAFPKTADDTFKQWQNSGIMVLAEGAIRQGKIQVQNDPTLNMIAPYIGMEQHLQETIQELSNSNDASQGKAPGSSTSGVAIDLLQRKGSALIEPILDNLRATNVMCALMEIELLVQQYKDRPLITSLKLERILGGLIARTPTDSGLSEMGEQLAEGALDVGGLIDSLDKSELDLAFDDFFATPTLKAATMQMFIDAMQKTGAPIDPRIIIETSDIPQKEKSMQLEFMAEQQAQAQAQALNGALPNQ